MSAIRLDSVSRVEVVDGEEESAARAARSPKGTEVRRRSSNAGIPSRLSLTRGLDALGARAGRMAKVAGSLKAGYA